MSPWPFAPLTPFKYGLLMVDFPWRFQLRSEAGEAKSPQAHYDTMSMEEIAALPIDRLAAPSCLMWMWCTHPMLDQQIAVARAWGCRFLTSGVWLKTTPAGKTVFGTGYWLRSATEPFALFAWGEPKSHSRSVRTVVVGCAREHSRKPDEAYAAAEMLAGPHVWRADIFARQTRPGWDAWGREAGKFDEVAA